MICILLCIHCARLGLAPRVQLLAGTWGCGQLVVEGLTIANTTAQKLRPVRNNRDWIVLLGQQTPERRVMPAQLVTRAVAMFPNALPQLLRFGNEFFARHALEVFIHDPPNCPE